MERKTGGKKAKQTHLQTFGTEPPYLKIFCYTYAHCENLTRSAMTPHVSTFFSILLHFLYLDSQRNCQVEFQLQKPRSFEVTVVTAEKLICSDYNWEKLQPQNFYTINFSINRQILCWVNFPSIFSLQTGLRQKL